MNDTKKRMIGVAYLGLLIVGVNSICTQFIAERLAYSPALGNALFARVYNPFSWWEWFNNFYSYAPNTYHHALLILLAGITLSFVAFRLYIGIKTRSPLRNEGSHGTAHFATPEEIRNSGLLPRKGKSGAGVYCGAYDDKKTGRIQYLRHDGPEHICVIAPTRSGKGVGLVIPTLLSWPESVFVLDPKGEDYAITAGWRKKHANNVILRFDPAEPGVSCAWNPLGEIRFGTRYQIGDAQSIALMVIDDDGKGIAGNHWRTAAHELLVGVIVHSLYKAQAVGRTPSLRDCALTLSSVGDFAAPDVQDEFDDGDVRPLTSLFYEMQNVTLANDTAAEEAQITIRAAGRRFSETSSKELTSIISTANNSLALYRDPIVGENTSRNDFKVTDLMNHDQPVSLYFITTFQDNDRMKPLARLLLSRILLGLSGQMKFENGRSVPTYKSRLLLMLDEFPSLGKMDVLQNSLAYIAGYGMKAYLITQDVQQLYQSYTSYESIISNCHIRLAYAPTKVETAEWLSKMAGQATIIKEHISISGKRFGMIHGNSSVSYQEAQRPLMTPNEIQSLPRAIKDDDDKIIEAGEMLIFVAGQQVIKGRQILYFLDPVFSARAKVPPPQISGVVRTNDPNGFAIT